MPNWTCCAVVLLALTGAAAADVTVSQSNDPSTGLNGQMTVLLGQEKAAMGALASGRVEQILTAPVQAAAVAAASTESPSDAGATHTAVKIMIQPAAGAAVPRVAVSAAAKPGLFNFKARAEARAAALAAAQAPKAPTYDAAWLATVPAVTAGNAEWSCMAKALYFEARGESIKGQAGVAEVILNRANSGLYPRSVCGVVNQGSKYACQFSFVCDGYSDSIREPAAYAEVGKVATLMLEGAPRTLTSGATHFRTAAVRPNWSRTFAQTAVIGSHYFYRQPMRVASN